MRQPLERRDGERKAPQRHREIVGLPQPRVCAGGIARPRKNDPGDERLFAAAAAEALEISRYLAGRTAREQLRVRDSRERAIVTAVRRSGGVFRSQHALAMLASDS